MRRSGLGIIMLLAVMLLVAWLTLGNFRSLNGSDTGSVDGGTAVEQAEDAVDSVNEHYDRIDDSLEQHYDDLESIGE